MQLQACEWFNSNEAARISSDNVVAVVNGDVLKKSDLQKKLPLYENHEDSVMLSENYINAWVKKKLLIQEATDKKMYDHEAIQKKVEDYRNSLIVYEFKKQYIKEHLDTNISSTEIQSYYQKNKNNFKLNRNILKGIFIKVNRKAPDIKKIKKQLYRDTARSLSDLKSYSYQYASSYSFNTNQWLEFEILLENTPFLKTDDKAAWLKNNKHGIQTDEQYIYLLKVLDYKTPGEIAPRGYVKDKIKNMILNKRKAQSLRKLENNLYKEALRNNDLQIQNKPVN